MNHRLHPRSLLALSATCWLAGCATYHPLPLKKSVIEERLREPNWRAVEVEASRIEHPLLPPVQVNLQAGLSPEQASVVAVVLSPELRAARDRRGLARAQVLQAGLLPNPQVSGGPDFVTGGTLVPGLVTGYGVTVDWDVRALLEHASKKAAAQATAQSVDLDVAWAEWQTAEAAKLAAYRVVADEAELSSARDVDNRLAENLAVIKKAANLHFKTELDLAAAASASQDAHAVVLGLEQDLAQQKLAFNRALGVPPTETVALRPDIRLPSQIETPSQAQLTAGLEKRRLDLLALRQGYASQEATLRAAIIGQFPRVRLGFNQASDTTDVHTTGPAVTFDLPVFDRNQGMIAIARATRQSLFDEYIARVFEARSDVASALAAMGALAKQIEAARMEIPALERLVTTYRRAVNEGNADVFSYYAAQNNLSQKRIVLSKLKLQLLENYVALELAAGRYLPLEKALNANQAPQPSP